MQRFVFPFVLFALPLPVVGCAVDDAEMTTLGAGSTGTAPSAGTAGTTDPTADPTSAAPGGPDSTDGGESSNDNESSTTAAGPPQITMETTLGTVVIELFPDESPITVANFTAYVDAGFYDGGDGLGATTFHRVIPEFMIQGGGETEAGMLKATRAAIVNEHDNGLMNLRGRLSMARTSAPDSATSQFFVNVVDNPSLDDGDGYAVFGEVIEGMDIVDAIVAVPTNDDVPVDTITITSMTLQQ